MLFSKKIRYLMKQKGITQRALSEKIGVNQPTISRWFNGQEPYSKALSRLSEEFNVPVELLQSDNLSEDEFISKLYIFSATSESITRIESLPICEKIAALEIQHKKKYSEEYKNILIMLSMLPDEYSLPLATQLTKNGMIDMAQDVLFVAGKSINP